MFRRHTRLIFALAAIAALPFATTAQAAAPASVCGVREAKRSTTAQAQIQPSQTGNFFNGLRAFAQQYGYRYTDSGGANLQNNANFWILSLDKPEYKDKLFLHIGNAVGSDTYTLTIGWCEGNADWKQHWDRFLRYAQSIPN